MGPLSLTQLDPLLVDFKTMRQAAFFHLITLCKPQSISCDESMAHTHIRYYSGSRWIQLMLLAVQREVLFHRAFVPLCVRFWQLSVKGGVSPCVLSSACEVPLCVGPPSRSSLIAPLLLSWTAPLSSDSSDPDLPDCLHQSFPTFFSGEPLFRHPVHNRPHLWIMRGAMCINECSDHF